MLFIFGAISCILKRIDGAAATDQSARGTVNPSCQGRAAARKPTQRHCLAKPNTAFVILPNFNVLHLVPFELVGHSL